MSRTELTEAIAQRYASKYSNGTEADRNAAYRTALGSLNVDRERHAGRTAYAVKGPEKLETRLV